MTEILEILKYVLPSIVVLITAYLMINSFLKNEQNRLALQYRDRHVKDILPLRLQAYERLSVFLERISPNNIIPRTIKPDSTAIEFQQALIKNIRMEYEHNLSQQIYVSSKVWSMINFVRDEIIKDINLIGASMPTDASAKDLSRKILEYYLESEDTIPTQKALALIKAEVKKLY